MLFVKKLCSQATLPSCTRPGEDLGYDVYASETATLFSGRVYQVRTGIAVEHSGGLGLLVRDRSSMAAKGIIVSGGVIDAGYRGEVMILMTYVEQGGSHKYVIEMGDKIAQMVPVQALTGDVVEMDTLQAADRGNKGFGSSGR